MNCGNLRASVSAPSMLHQTVIWLVIVIFVSAFGTMFWACCAYRNSKGGPRFHANATIEILWTVIPAIVLLAIAWPVIKAVIA